MKRRIVRKQVTFNLDDQEQRELLLYARSLENFSGRIKRLLKEDYERHLRIQQLEQDGLQVRIGSGGIKIK